MKKLTALLRSGLVATGAALLAAALAGAPAVAGTTPEATASPNVRTVVHNGATTTYYRLRNLNDQSKCMGVPPTNGRLVAGTKVILWDCVDSDDQYWTRSFAGLHVRMYNLYDPTKCLGVPGGTSNPGTQLVIWDCDNRIPDQLWSSVGSSAPHCIIVQNGQTGQLAGVSQGRTDRGAPVVQWPWAGVPDQSWCNSQF